ncbi:MAG: prepilin-type N-terminal cleavage/methylation domain-containing protein [Planctomycetota bacterium]
MVNRERGYTVMELTIAVAVVAMLAGAALSGGTAHFATVGRAYDELRTSEVAADRLEMVSAADAAPVPGERTFVVPAGMSGSERVRVVEPGLYEVRVRVTKPGARPAELTTLLARGEYR